MSNLYDFGGNKKFPHTLISEITDENGKPLEEYLGKGEGVIDLTDTKKIEIPIPNRLIKVNIVSASLPTKKTDNIDAEIEYNDGNYKFKKKIILNAQGNSTMLLIKKNFAFDFVDCKIKFGHWVQQDSFHLKANYSDVMCGYNMFGYRFAEQCIEELEARPNRVLSASTTKRTSTGTFSTDFNEALCHPDGFPVEIYHNGEYYGLYVFSIKKHRDNYSMGKSDYHAIHLDGQIDAGTLMGGSINWSAFEIRNPKKLILQDGVTEYDGDAPVEIIGADSANYNAENTDHVKTAEAKGEIVRLSNAVATINSKGTTALKRQTFESIFDVQAFLCYDVVSQILLNIDGYSKNWQWLLYNGKWSPSFYDMDMLFSMNVFHFGYKFDTNYDAGADNELVALFRELYSAELKATYEQLKDAGIATRKNIMKIVRDWLKLVGASAIERNLKKWTATPSYRPAQDVAYEDGTANGGGLYDSPERINKWLKGRFVWLDSYYA